MDHTYHWVNKITWAQALHPPPLRVGTTPTTRGIAPQAYMPNTLTVSS